MADNIYQELRDILKDFKEFLDENVPKIQPAIQALASLIPQITELIDTLIDLMNDLKKEIQDLDPSSVPNLQEVSDFTERVIAFLEATKNLLPEQADEIDEAIRVGRLVDLGALTEIRDEIIKLIEGPPDGIIAHLESLKPA